MRCGLAYLGRMRKAQGERLIRRGLAVALAVLAWVAGPVMAAVPKAGEEPLPEAAPVPVAQPENAEPGASLPLPPVPRHRAVPTNAPGTWFSHDDYPAEALRYSLQGTTAFRLLVDAGGDVRQCTVTQGSGFEVLDRATCTLLSARAHFRPARDRRGRPARDVYDNRIAWRLPERHSAPLGDFRYRVALQINRLGKVTGCRGDDMPLAVGDALPGCAAFSRSMPSYLGLAARDYGGDDERPVVFDLSLTRTGPFTEKALGVPDGAVSTAGLAWRFAVNADGRVTGCALIRQTGNAALISDMCKLVAGRFMAATDQPAGAPPRPQGWILLRYYYKAGP